MSVTCLGSGRRSLGQLRAGSHDAITTAAHWETLPGATYLLVSSSGQLSSVKNAARTPRSTPALPLGPAIAAPGFIKDICPSHRLGRNWGGGGLSRGSCPRAGYSCEPGSACGTTASPEPFGKSHKPRVKLSPSAPQREARALIAAPALGAPPGFPSHSASASAPSNNPASSAGGTERRLQTVSQGLVNVAALAPRRLPFEPSAACHPCL